MTPVDTYMRGGAPHKFYLLDDENDIATNGKIGRNIQAYNGVEMLDIAHEYGFYIKKHNYIESKRGVIRRAEKRYKWLESKVEIIREKRGDSNATTYMQWKLWDLEELIEKMKGNLRLEIKMPQ